MYDNTDDKPLPKSSDAMAGMTPSAQGDASRADVARGYFTIGNDVVNAPPAPPPEADPIKGNLGNEGFAGRPWGWER